VKRIITALPCAAFALCAQLAQAQDVAPGQRLWLNAGAYSYHFDHGKNLRNDNWGFGAEYWFTREQAAMAGSFINSNRQRTHYAAWQWRPLNTQWGPVKVGAGLALGVFDGYPNYRNGGAFPIAMPVVTLEYGRVGLNLYPTPRIRDRVDAALSFQFKLAVW